MPETVTAPETGAEMLARVKPQPRIEETTICLRPDLLAKWEDAQADLQEMQVADAVGGKRIGTGHSAELKKQAKYVQELEAEIDATQTTFVFEGMNKDRWQALCDEHPPRKGNEMDFYVGYQRDSVTDESVRKCLLTPVFLDCVVKGCEHDECGSWQQLTKTINPGEWAELRTATQKANRAVVSPPKSGLASQVLAKGGTTSRRPAPGE